LIFCDIEDGEIELDSTRLSKLKAGLQGEEFVGVGGFKTLGTVSTQEVAGEMDDDDEDEQDEATEDSDILEMFAELSKGKDSITLKQLMKWDEVQELITSELVPKDVIDSYIKQLNLTSDRLNLADFTKFINLLDQVLVDESGNILGEGGIDLDSIDFDDDDDEVL
jgi:hypothetical protein